MKRYQTRFVVLLCATLPVTTLAGCSQEPAAGDGAFGDRKAQAPADLALQRPENDEGAGTGDAAGSARQRFDFDQGALGTVPEGFSEVHSGDGAPGVWRVVAAEDAPSGSQVVAQTDSDRTNYRFPLLVLGSVIARDMELSVAGKPISGSKDQAIGLIWRYRDADNYYVVRANALEDNVVLYKMERGKRSDLDLRGQRSTYGLDAEVPKGAWSRLGVRVEGNLFTVFLDGRELFQVEDQTFTGAGKVGLWTKADSVTWFDDLDVVVLDAVESPDSAPGEGAQ